MAINEDLMRELPYLRQYARALTGSQEWGDEYIRITLELLDEEPDRLETGTDRRLALFKAFHDTWKAVKARSDKATQAAPFTEERFRQSLANLPPVEHQVLLLRDVLQFGPGQTATILDLQRSEMEGLLTRGRQRIEAEAGAEILIIEDEGPIALDLQSIVEEMGHQVCGIAAEKATALEIALRESPDLILSDLRLRGEDDGISTVQDILTSMDVPVIFVTAYPERMLTGNRLEPTFIIPKPYNVRALKTAIGHSLVFETAEDDGD